MIAKAKVISHGANAIRYSVDKDKAEIVKTNLLPDDISPMAMWARMLALQKKFEDKLNRSIYGFLFAICKPRSCIHLFLDI